MWPTVDKPSNSLAEWLSTSGDEANCRFWPVDLNKPVWARPLQNSWFGLPHTPPALMFEGVVVPAQVSEIVGARRATMLSCHGVVEVAAIRWPAAARESTSSISDAEKPSQLF